MQATSPIEILKSLGLLSWTALAVGWERGWVTKASLADYATDQLQSDASEVDLAATATLASAERLDTAEITQPLKHLSGRSPEGEACALEKWRLARLIELQSEQLDWDEKVTRLEELGAEFGYPADMRLCSRYVTSDQAPNSDPLDAMVDVISDLRRRLGVG